MIYITNMVEVKERKSNKEQDRKFEAPDNIFSNFTQVEEETVREIIRDELQDLIKKERYTFIRLIQMLDGRNIQLGKTTGTIIATETDQKLGFFNTTPIIQQTTSSQTPATFAAPLKCS